VLFAAAAGRLDHAPADIWYIGDRHEFDVEGARGAGMTAIWYNRAGRDGGGLQDAELRSWSELAGLLDGA